MVLIECDVHIVRSQVDIIIGNRTFLSVIFHLLIGLFLASEFFHLLSNSNETNVEMES